MVPLARDFPNPGAIIGQLADLGGLLVLQILFNSLTLLFCLPVNSSMMACLFAAMSSNFRIGVLFFHLLKSSPIFGPMFACDHSFFFEVPIPTICNRAL